MRRKKLFKTSLLIYTILILLIAIIFLTYIYFTLKEYEANQTNNFIKNTISAIDDQTLKDYLKNYNQDENLLSEYKELINSDKVKISKIGENDFEVSLNDQVLLNIQTKLLKTETKLGMFSYEVRKVTNIKPNLERGIIYYDLTIPSNYTLFINNQIYNNISSKEKYEDLDFMYYNESMPYLNTYKINYLSSKDIIKVLDEKQNEVKLEKKQNLLKVDKYYLSFDNYEEAKNYLDKDLDIWDFAHKWSLFLTNDLKGVNHGFNEVKDYFIEGTQMYTRAYNWAHNIDINFTSKHTFKDEIWSNEKLDNFKVYSKDAFSCKIYSEKNMIVNGKDQKDVMNDTLYFIKNNGEWKVINIKSGG